MSGAQETKEGVFHPITMEDREMAESYLSEYGERSCQHSFPALFCLGEKYRTQVAEAYGCLLVRQLGKDEPNYESCLMPLGGGNRRAALTLLREGAKSRGRGLKLETITESAARFLEESFPGEFSIREERDYAEYLYRRERLTELAGSEMQDIRYFYRRFHRRMGGRAAIERICPENLPELLAFQAQWLSGCRDKEDYPTLVQEDAAIRRACAHFKELGFFGILLRVDGAVRGYAMGCGISGAALDVFFEKGDRAVRDIYRSLVTDMLKEYGEGYEWVSREEDLGDPGMRQSKLAYRPDILMKKYIAREKCLP